MKILILLIMFFSYTLIACGNDKSNKTTNQNKIPQNIVIIDVRTAYEWQQGHLEGAIHLPLDIIASEIEKKVKDKNTPIALYCRSGRRSGIATSQLRALGYKNVENYGGYNQASQTLGKKIVTD